MLLQSGPRERVEGMAAIAGDRWEKVIQIRGAVAFRVAPQQEWLIELRMAQEDPREFQA